MGKRLPYFQFEPAEYLTGDIMFCSLASQGLFNQINCLYWQKECKLSFEQAVKRLNNKELFEELINENIIKIIDGFIIINFLNTQYYSATEKSKINSENGKKGAENRWKQREVIATPLKNDSESIALREDKIKEKKIIEDKIKVLEFLTLSSSQIESIKMKYGEEAYNFCTKKLNDYKGSTGKKYKSDYHTILGWVMDEFNKQKINNNGKQTASNQLSSLIENL